MLIRHGLLGSLKGGFAATWAVVFVILPITSHRRSVAILRVSLVLRTSLLFEFCVLLHQLLAIRCPSSNLLNLTIESVGGDEVQVSLCLEELCR